MTTPDRSVRLLRFECQARELVARVLVCAQPRPREHRLDRRRFTDVVVPSLTQLAVGVAREARALYPSLRFEFETDASGRVLAEVAPAAPLKVSRTAREARRVAR
jgi:hypothetical protein